MSRVKRGTIVKKRHKKILALAKGYRHGRKNIFRLAKQAVIRAHVYQYRDRKVRKRDFRSLWIIRINAAVRKHGITYSQFMSYLKKNGPLLDRKILAHLALSNPSELNALIEKAKIQNKTVSPIVSNQNELKN